jgi:acylphosphatase
LKSVRARVLITGLVQGVSFRFYTKRKADSLGLAGWVRNDDGGVEAVFEGPEDKVKEMLDWCRKGPSFARVDNVDIDFMKHTGEFEDFRIIPY